MIPDKSQNFRLLRDESPLAAGGKEKSEGVKADQHVGRSSPFSNETSSKPNIVFNAEDTVATIRMNFAYLPRWAGICLLVCFSSAFADPCGMVPPIRINSKPEISRIGRQLTYVFFKDGIETIVIRPGFSGKVDEFGMLVPLPSVPSIRKVSDDIFTHIAAAIDPPAVTVDRSFGGGFGGGLGGGGGGLGGGTAADGFSIRRDEVRVLKEEAVGMYEVVVLAAGSSEALKKWMTEHRFRYPEGMDDACEDYVKDGWCFTAVRARVAAKAAVDPRPGMKAADTKLPEGAAFDGYVQAMGFRFRVDKLVVPMRLSAFNEGKLDNTVFVLAEQPQRIRGIDTAFVVRQVDGTTLYNNLTNPLPLRMIGVKASELSAEERADVRRQRVPTRVNGFARHLFGADLLAVEQNRLVHDYESLEKELFAINEQFGLRGTEISEWTHEAVTAEREAAIRTALGSLKGMTLTVIQGEFPRDFLAQENLTFSKYRMDPKRNSSKFYYAPLFRRSHVQLSPKEDPAAASKYVESPRSSRMTGWLFTAGALMILGLRFSSWRIRCIAGAAIGICVFSAAAQDVKENDPTLELVAKLNEATTAQDAVDKLVELGPTVVPHLVARVNAATSLAARGRIIVALERIGSAQARRHLEFISNDDNENRLVRVWAGAARLRLTQTPIELLELSRLSAVELPPLLPLFTDRLHSFQDDSQSREALVLMLRVTATSERLGRELADAIHSFKPEVLVELTYAGKDNITRRQAAAIVASLGPQMPKREVAALVLKRLKFDPKAENAPWTGGALYIPSLSWSKEDARQLIGTLLAWGVWASGKSMSEEYGKIEFNLRSVSLFHAAEIPYSALFNQCLINWGKAVGKEKVFKLLEQQNAHKWYEDVVRELEIQ